MIDTLLEPFGYAYMFSAIWVSSLVGSVCAFLSAYLMLKGWSLIGSLGKLYFRSLNNILLFPFKQPRI